MWSLQRFDDMMDWLARLYIKTLNVIHYMHDKYAYEYIQMALHDRDVNAARNILSRFRAGCGHAAPAEGIPAL